MECFSDRPHQKKKSPIGYVKKHLTVDWKLAKMRFSQFKKPNRLQFFPMSVCHDQSVILTM